MDRRLVVAVALPVLGAIIFAMFDVRNERRGKPVNWPTRALWLVLFSIAWASLVTCYGCSLTVDAQGDAWSLDAGQLEPDASDEPRNGSVDVAHDPVKMRPDAHGPDAHVAPELDAGAPLEHDAGPILEPCNAEKFSADDQYVQFALVVVDGALYQCRPYPVDHLCDDTGYEPGSGPMWREAWNFLRFCRP